MRLQYSGGVLSIEVAGRTREIGKVANRVLTVFRSRKEHYMRKYDGYGFSYDVMSDNRLFDYVLIEEKVDEELTNYYLVARDEIILHGIPDQTEDFEKQVFLPLHILKKINQT